MIRFAMKRTDRADCGIPHARMKKAPDEEEVNFVRGFGLSVAERGKGSVPNCRRRHETDDVLRIDEKSSIGKKRCVASEALLALQGGGSSRAGCRIATPVS